MGIPRRLHDFSVTLVANGAEYTSLVEQSPAGRGQGHFTAPIQRTELEPLRRLLSVVVPASGHPRDIDPPPSVIPSPYKPEALGKKIGEGLFTGEVKRLHDRSLGVVQSTPEEGLRLGLHLNLSDANVAWLGQLPWEFIRDEHNFLLLDSKKSLVRYLDIPGALPRAQIKQPLKVLVVLASPKGVPPLAAASEYRELDRSFSNSPSVRVELLDRATPERLGQRVQEETFHVVHFVGHAGFDSENGQGRFLLETEYHEPSPVSAEQLANLLRGGQDTPQLLVLNACETARFSWQDDHDPWSGLATALLMAGFPAVVAMQFPITDKAAVAFSRGFYGLFAAGYPIDLAVTGGRRAIFIANHLSLEWATPVLFLRDMKGNIFRVKARRPKQRTVVIETHDRRKNGEVPYGDKLVDGLADFLKIAPADLKRENESSPFKIELPAAAAERLLKAAKSSEAEFESRREALAISSIVVRPDPGPVITFALGIFGNLIATLIGEGPLRGFFTPPRIVILLLLTLIFLRWDLFARIRRRFGPRRVIATLFACAVLVELDLPTARPLSLNLSGDHVTDISAQDLQGIQHLSGRAVLSNPGTSCICDWSGKTDQDEEMTTLGSSPDCSFTIDLPAQYNRIHLLLKVGEKTDLFVIRVQ
jgi:hypothetical protein